VVALLGVGVVNGEWLQVWADEFEGGNLRDRWNFEVNCDGGGNNELQCYTDNLEKNCKQENGVLVITALKDSNNPGHPFTSTRITTKANWLHGKFDIRARAPLGKHLWPAIWMMPTRSEYGGWPRSGEIDIFEYRGQRPNEVLGTLHYGPAWDNKGQVGYERNMGYDLSAGFHTYTLDWSPMQMQWIIDDVVIHTESLARNFWSGLYTGNGQPFDKDFFLIINLAVGGAFFGGEPFDPNESDGWPKRTFEIDYVRKFEWR
jgi:beta-glucanase (GH16 family)